jgi:uncharacterized membrane protein YcaP (DUF421 family)
MQTHIIQPMLTLALFILVTSLFVYIKYYLLNRELTTPRMLLPHELAISVFLGLIVFYVVGNRSLSLEVKSIFLLAATALHYGMSVVEFSSKGRRLMYPKSFMIFHNGKFLKGAIVQNKLTDEDIQRLLHGKGVVDLKEVDTLILEQNGELLVIYKNKNTAAS